MEAVKLAALRVSPDLDAGKYTAGAAQIDAANDSIARSSVAAGNAVQQMGPKVSEAGNLVARLSHQYIDGYGTSAKFQKGLDNLQRAIETGNIEMAQSEAILEGMYRRLGILANAEDLAAAGQHQLAAAAANANAKIAAQEAIAEGAANGNRRLGDMSKYAAMQQRNLVFQLNDVAVSLASGMNPLMVFMQQGSQIATIYGPEEGGVGRALQETGNLALGLVSKFWPIAGAVAGATAAIAGMTYEINRTSDVTVGFGDTALATWQVISNGIYQWIKPAIEAVAPWFAAAWDWVTGTTRDVGNFIVREVVGATDIISTTLASIPDGLVIAFEAGAQAISDVLTFIAQESIATVNGLINNINGLSRATGMGDLISTLGDPNKIAPYSKVDLGGAAAVDRMGARWGDLGKRSDALAQRDFMGEFFGAVSGQSQANALARLAEDADKASGSLAAANDNFGAFLDKVNEGQMVFEDTRSPLEELGAELGRLDMMLAEGVISWDTYQRAATQAITNTASTVLGSIGQMTGMLAQAFEDNKALAIANAVVKGGEAVVSSYAAGSSLGGPILGAVFAGIAAATTAKQIADIASSNKDSRSLGGGAAAAAPSIPTAPVAAAGGRSLSVSLHGEYQRTSSVRDLVEQIVEYFGDRDLQLNLSHQ